MILIDSITINPKNITIKKGTWYSDACAEILPENATCKCLIWRSTNKNIASVNESGHIYGVSEGTAAIYATAKDGSGKVAFCHVTVTSPIKVTSIMITPNNKQVIIGETFQLSASVSPRNADDKRIRWTSLDSNIAEVDSITGCVISKAVGSTCIHANAQDGSGIVGGCQITVFPSTVPGLNTLKQCRVRKDMSMNDSAILKDSSGATVMLNIGDTVPLLSNTPISANGRIWYRILYNGMMLYVTADDASFEEINVPPSISEGRDIFANPGLDLDINIRSTPSKTSENIIGEFAHGTFLTLTCNTPQNSEWFAVYGINKNGAFSYGWCSGKYLAYYFLNTIRDCYVRTDMIISPSTILKDSSGKNVILRENTVDSVRLWKLNRLVGGDYEDYNGNIRNDWFMVEYSGQIAYVTADSFYVFGFGEPLIEENQEENNPSDDNMTAMPAHASNSCLEFIIDYEGKNFWPTARDDGYGNLTIGYGHVVKSGESFGTITEEEALELFAQDISATETMVKNFSKNRNKIWSQQEYDAFVSLAYNAGIAVSSVMDEIIVGIDPYDAFSKICNASGKFSLGLYRRRMDEADIFVYGEYQREDRESPYN